MTVQQNLLVKTVKIPDFIDREYSAFIETSIEKSIEDAISKNKPALSFIMDIPLILKDFASNVGLSLYIKSFGISDFTDKHIKFSIYVSLRHSEQLTLKLLDSLASLDIKTDDFIEYIKNDFTYSIIFASIFPDSIFKKPFLKNFKNMNPAEIFRCLIHNSKIKNAKLRIYENHSSYDQVNFDLTIPLSSLHKNVSMEVSEFLDLKEKKSVWSKEKLDSLIKYENIRLPAVLISDIQYQSIKIKIDEIREEINKLESQREEIYSLILKERTKLFNLESNLESRKKHLASIDKKENLPIKTSLSFSNKRYKALLKFLSYNLCDG